jgi:hypothetical protein
MQGHGVIPCFASENRCFASAISGKAFANFGFADEKGSAARAEVGFAVTTGRFADENAGCADETPAFANAALASANETGAFADETRVSPNESRVFCGRKSVWFAGPKNHVFRGRRGSRPYPRLVTGQITYSSKVQWHALPRRIKERSGKSNSDIP